MTTGAGDSLAWSVLIAEGRWADLVTDAVRSHDRVIVGDAAALIEVEAPAEIKTVLVRRLRQVVSGQWEAMIAEAAQYDVHDTDLVDQLRRAVAALDHVGTLIPVGAPLSQQERLLRRVKSAKTTVLKTLDRELRYAGAAPATASPALPGRSARRAAARPATPQVPPAVDAPGVGASGVGASGVGMPSPTAQATTDAAVDAAVGVMSAGATSAAGPAGDAVSGAVSGVVDDSVEMARWERELAAAVAKANKRRVEIGLTEIVLSEQLIVDALAEWHGAITVEGDALRFVSTPTWTGLCLARWLCKRYPVIPTPTAVPWESVIWKLPRRRGCRLMRVISFFDQSVAFAAGDVLVEVDVNSQHLAAARGVALGDGEPTHVLDTAGVARWITATAAAKRRARPRELTAEDLRVGWMELVRRPGYVVLAAKPDLSGLPTPAALAFAKADAGTILPMPLAAYLVDDHGVALDVAEAIFWDTRPALDPRSGKEVERRAYGQRLEKWATVITEGRARLMERATDDTHPAALALLMLKPMYARFTGAFLRSEDVNINRDTGEPTGWLRPDWYDQLVARASANMLRALDKAAAMGLAAVAGLKDAVWAVVPRPLDDDAAPKAPAGLEESRQSGKWKVNRWAVVDEEILDAYARGRVVPLREALTKADTDRIRSRAVA